MNNAESSNREYVSIRRIAEKLGISKSAVSLALKDSPRIKKETVLRVKKAAEELGYRKNSMVSNMMSHMRKSSVGNFRETIALLNGNRDKNAFKNHSTLPIYKKSVMKEAAEFGYNIDEFWLLDPLLNCKKLSSIMRARGIRGGIIMGHTEDCVFKSYAKIWSDFKIVSVGISVHNPAYELVCSNQFEVSRKAVERLVQLGFRRPAIVVDKDIDYLVDGRFYGGFFSALYDADIKERIDPFGESINSPTYYLNLQKFIERENPDVILYMFGKTGDFISKYLRQKDGSKYPIAQLERRNDGKIFARDWSGMEQNNDISAEFAVRRLAALLNMPSPNYGPTTLIPPTWVESKLLLSQARRIAEKRAKEAKKHSPIKR